MEWGKRPWQWQDPGLETDDQGLDFIRNFPELLKASDFASQTL